MGRGGFSVVSAAEIPGIASRTAEIAETAPILLKSMSRLLVSASVCSRGKGGGIHSAGVECHTLETGAQFMEPTRSEVTQLLQQWSDGRQEALDRLLPQIYAELRRLASSYLWHERRDHTLQATALVHEAFLKLVDQRAVRWQSRAHFFGIAAQAMRRILVDHARAHTAAKRGDGDRPLSLDDVVVTGAM